MSFYNQQASRSKNKVFHVTLQTKIIFINNILFLALDKDAYVKEKKLNKVKNKGPVCQPLIVTEVARDVRWCIDDFIFM